MDEMRICTDSVALTTGLQKEGRMCESAQLTESLTSYQEILKVVSHQQLSNIVKTLSNVNNNNNLIRVNMQVF